MAYHWGNNASGGKVDEDMGCREGLGVLHAVGMRSIEMTHGVN